jgi:hypothetical protein
MNSDKIVIKGILYEAIDFQNVYDNFKKSIDFLQNAKNGITDKNELRTIKACQKKIQKTYLKLKQLEKDRYSAKFRPLSDEERLANLKKSDAQFEKTSGT